MKHSSTFVGLTLALLLGSISFASVPKLINFQGVLKDGSGNPVANASYSVTFTIYDAATGGNNFWTETQSVTTTDGLFAVLLGASNPVPDTAFQSSERWLGIAVSPDPEMAVRQQLVTVGYAYRVNSVDSASGGTITTKVSIGPGHTNTGAFAFVAGDSNTASGNYSTVGGGLGNVASNGIATVSGGFNNTASGAAATIGGGQYDTARASFSTVGGGLGNVASSGYATVSGGNGNRAGGGAATVGGGQSNTASGADATIGGGGSNTASATYATIGGGFSDTASGAYATVGGGSGNTADTISATVGGGNSNKASGVTATIGGGNSNTATTDNATVGGGQYNTASGAAATIGGGADNIANATYATVGGGFSDTTSGLNSTVPGGRGNKAAGNYSFAAGTQAKALHSGSFVWGDNTFADFASTANNQFLIRAAGGVGIGINAPSAPLQVGFLGEEGTPVFIAGTKIVAQATNADNWTHMAIISGSFGQARLNFGDGFNDDQGSVGYNNVNDAMFFSTAAAERMRITSAGNVGIGTTTPQGALDVSSTTGAFIVPRMTTVQRNALTAVNGMIIYNTDAVVGGRFEFRENGAWVTK